MQMDPVQIEIIKCKSDRRLNIGNVGLDIYRDKQ